MKTNPLLVFGRTLHRLRNGVQLTQEQLAEKADISRTFLQEIERGSKSPSLRILLKLKNALACSWNELLDAVG